MVYLQVPWHVYALTVSLPWCLQEKVRTCVCFARLSIADPLSFMGPSYTQYRSAHWLEVFDVPLLLECDRLLSARAHTPTQPALRQSHAKPMNIKAKSHQAAAAPG